MTVPDKDFRNKTIGGMSWSLLAQLIVQGFSLIITAILARLLTPTDYGLIGMVMVFVGFARLFSKLGFGQALIQKIDISDKHLSSVFWLNIAIGGMLTILLVLSSPLIANFYREPQLVPLLITISITFLITPCNIVQRSILQRELNFRTLSLLRISSNIVAGIIAVIMAFRGFGVWSLVTQILVSSFVEVVATWFVVTWRPQFRFDYLAVRSLLRYSLNFSGYTFVDYWARNADNLLIGRYLGTSMLGIYSRAYSLMLLPISQIFVVVSQVMYPVLAKIQEDIDKVRNVYIRATGLLMFVSAPIMLGLWALAQPFIGFYLGPNWNEVVPILQYLCIVGLIRTLTITGKWVFQSQGHVHTMFRWEIFRTSIVIAGFAIGIISYGTLEKVVQIYLLVSLLFLVPDMWWSTRIINLHLTTLFKAIAPLIFCAAIMAIIVYIFDQNVMVNSNNLIRVIVGVAIGGFIYWGLAAVFRLQQYKELRMILIEQWQMKIKNVRRANSA